MRQQPTMAKTEISICLLSNISFFYLPIYFFKKPVFHNQNYISSVHKYSFVSPTWTIGSCCYTKLYKWKKIMWENVCYVRQVKYNKNSCFLYSFAIWEKNKAKGRKHSSHTWGLRSNEWICLCFSTEDWTWGLTHASQVLDHWDIA